MRRPLLMCGIMFVLGELTYRLAEESIWLSALTILVGTIIVYVSAKCTKKKSNNLLLFLFLFLGVIWSVGYYTGERNSGFEEIYSSGKKTVFVAYVTDIEEKDGYNKVYLRTKDGRLIMNQMLGEDSRRCVGLKPGDYAVIRGYLMRPEGSSNPGSFDRERYLLGKGIRYELSAENIEVDTTRRGWIRAGLYSIRCWMARRLEIAFGEEDASLLKTMLLGDRSELDTNTKIMFQRCGIAHILAISGLHVALIARVFETFIALLGVRKRPASIIVIIFVVAYGIMTGMSAATLRAVLMLSISRLAFVFGRMPDLPTSMMEALLVMIIINPESLTTSGMLMSFSAVMGVITGMELDKLILDHYSFRWLKEGPRGWVHRFVKGLLISISINLWMLPLVIMNYYEVPILALLLNFIVVPLLTVVVACGLIGAIGGPILVIPIWVCKKLLSFYRFLCVEFLKVPAAIVGTGHVSIIHLLVIYVVIGGVVAGAYISLYRRKAFIMTDFGKKWRVVVLMSLLGVFVLLCTFCIGSVKLVNRLSSCVVFLDVGQGDGSIIHLKGDNYMVDCGSSSSDDVGRYTLIPALKYYGMTHIKCIFISHMDSDHVNGIIYLLENRDLYGIDVDYVAVAEGTEVNENYERIQKACGSEVKIIDLGAGDVVDERFEVIYPGVDSEVSGVKEGNDYSLVLKLIGKEYEILYTGDIGNEVEMRLVSDGLSDSEEMISSDKTIDSKIKSNYKEEGVSRILKCPHHG
ncbi:MAG: ComEC/Rec2 family competence protein, partial [Eubacterium sp.]|nr:ComEC/Rec2 family competence protein [Eubacterium sp.]